MEEQDLFSNEKSMKATLKMIPNIEFRRICESVFKGLVLIYQILVKMVFK